MPTAAKLFSCLAFAGVGFAASMAIIWFVLPEQTLTGYFTHINVVLGAIIGWRSVGPRVSEGAYLAMMQGMLGALYLFGLALFLQSFWEMNSRGVDLRYSEVEEAAKDMMDIAARWAKQAFVPEVMGALFGGGALAGLLGHMVSRVWR